MHRKKNTEYQQTMIKHPFLDGNKGKANKFPEELAFIMVQNTSTSPVHATSRNQ